MLLAEEFARLRGEPDGAERRRRRRRLQPPWTHGPITSVFCDFGPFASIVAVAS